MIVQFHKDVEDYLVELIEVLYEREYFGFKESAIQYVRELIFEIRNTISKKTKKVAPKYFSKYGENLFYTNFRKNKTTSWYVFFNIENTVYTIYYIGNNHSVSHYLSE